MLKILKTLTISSFIKLHDKAQPILVDPDLLLQHFKPKSICPDMLLQRFKPNLVCPDLLLQHFKPKSICPDMLLQQFKPKSICPDMLLQHFKPNQFVLICCCNISSQTEKMAKRPGKNSFLGWGSMFFAPFNGSWSLSCIYNTNFAKRIKLIELF